LYRKCKINIYKFLKNYRDCDIYEIDLILCEKQGFDTKYLEEPSMFDIDGVKTKCYELKDIVFGLDPKTETKIIIYKPKK
jgi:hypothetical protein